MSSAGFGQTLLNVLGIDRNRSYVAFEPSLFCCFYIERLVELNGFPNCIIIPIGLSNESALLELHFSR